jgi:DNA-binding NarL/FixJ family response regulator
MAATKKAALKLSKQQSEHLAGLTQTASKIRYLASEGMSRGDIARVLGIRYQWVRNVLITPLKTQG